MSADDTQGPAETPADDFNPGGHMMSLSGKAYLEVKWRLVWLRSQHPDAIIDTDMHRDDGSTAVFKARVTLPAGGSATGWGSESYQDFTDYIEKAETKALGRALAALGYGTQFVEDGGAAGRPVDSPVDRGDRGRQPFTQGRVAGDTATDRQIKAIYAVGRAGRLSDADISRRIQERFGCPPEQLQRRDASDFIDLLKQEMAGHVPTPAPAPVTTITPASLPGKPTDDGPSEAQLRKLHAVVREQNWQPDAVRAAMRDLWGVASSKDLTKYQCGLLIDIVEGRMQIERDAAGKARLGQVPPAADGLRDEGEMPWDAEPAR